MFFSRQPNANRRSCIRHLMVVEDDALLAFDHEHALTAAGYSVVATVNSGEAARKVLGNAAIDAVILDLNIDGDVDGADVARIAHEQGVLVLLVSGDAPGAAAAHSVGHLAKPLANGALVAALRSIEAVHCRNEAPRRVPGMTHFA